MLSPGGHCCSTPALGALVFGIVIVNAIRSRGVESPALITRYAIIAGLIAGVGLALVYISLFRLGATSHDIAADATNGAAVLHAYVQHTFGSLGSGFLAVYIAGIVLGSSSIVFRRGIFSFHDAAHGSVAHRVCADLRRSEDLRSLPLTSASNRSLSSDLSPFRRGFQPRNPTRRTRRLSGRSCRRPPRCA